MRGLGLRALHVNDRGRRGRFGAGRAGAEPKTK